MSFDELAARLDYKAAHAGDLRAAERTFALGLRIYEARLRYRVTVTSGRMPEKKSYSYLDADAALQLLGIAYIVRGKGFGLDPDVVSFALTRLGREPDACGPWSPYVHSREAEITPFKLEEDPRFGPPPPKRSSRETQWKKGQSGNPRGRPKREHDTLNFGFLDEELARTVAGRKLTRTRLEWLVSDVARRAFYGGDEPARVMLQKYLYKEAFRALGTSEILSGEIIRDDIAELRDVPLFACLAALGLVSRRTKRKILLMPWIVEHALDGFGDKRLTREEQAVVIACTSTPGKVSWPAWWQVHSKAND